MSLKQNNVNKYLKTTSENMKVYGAQAKLMVKNLKEYDEAQRKESKVMKSKA